MTPSCSGRVAMMFPGVLPSISLASSPTERTLPLLALTATTVGSAMMMPLPFW